VNLDWNFYYDDWLIDKVPDGLEIKVVRDEEGELKCIPSSLTCYFGANPIYLYGEGKLWHESLISPRGMAIYPEFLGRPGFEWVSRETFSVSFPKEVNFHEQNVVSLHTGKVNATQYIKDVFLKMYGIKEDEFTNIRTPSTTLRKLNHNDYILIEKGISDLQIYPSGTDMMMAGCALYTRMFIESGREGPTELMKGRDLPITSPGTPILVPGIFTDVAFLKYSYVEISKDYQAGLFREKFAIMLRTLPNFRAGIVLDFGCTSLSEDNTNYGMRLEMAAREVIVTLNDGNLNTFILPCEVDLRFGHSWAIIRNDDTLTLSIDGALVSQKSTAGIGRVKFHPEYKNYISRSSVSGQIETAGDIEELALFSQLPSDKVVEDFFDGTKPFIKKGGANQLERENIPSSLSYELTYSKPTDFFIPNHFEADFYKYYLKNKDKVVIIAGYDEDGTNSSYRDDLEPIEDKSLLVPLGYNIDQVLSIEDDEVSEEIPVLTKLTSDSHIPIKIHMDFIVPEGFYHQDVVYNIRLVMRSLDRFLWYSFKKFKTGEFV